MSETKYTSRHLEFLRTKALSPSFVSALDDIAEFGWQAMLIKGSNSDRFAYSVGIYDMFGFPELIVVGLPEETAHSAMQYALEAMQNGVDLTVGRHREIVGDVEVMFRPVDDRWKGHVMCRADWFYSGEPFPALQLIYPDIENRFQDEEGFNEYFRQPMLASEIHEGTREREFWDINDLSETEARWKFSDTRDTIAFLSGPVQRKEEAVTYVSHDHNGDWQFLGDSMSNDEKPVLVCLHHPIDDDSSLEALHDLPVGWWAERSSLTGAWERFELPPDEEEQADEPDAALLN
jgi:hypothetical protein